MELSRNELSVICEVNAENYSYSIFECPNCLEYSIFYGELGDLETVYCDSCKEKVEFVVDCNRNHESIVVQSYANPELDNNR